MAAKTTVIVNNTQQDLTMQVGNHRYFVHFAKLAKGAKKNLLVDYNDTYQEYLMGEDKAGKKLIVTSDECCDYKSITITESNGEFDVQRVPRRRYAASGSVEYSSDDEAAAPASKKKFSWRFWKS